MKSKNEEQEKESIICLRVGYKRNGLSGSPFIIMSNGDPGNRFYNPPSYS